VEKWTPFPQRHTINQRPGGCQAVPSAYTSATPPHPPSPQGGESRARLHLPTGRRSVLKPERRPSRASPRSPVIPLSTAPPILRSRLVSVNRPVECSASFSRRLHATHFFHCTAVAAWSWTGRARRCGWGRRGLQLAFARFAAHAVRDRTIPRGRTGRGGGPRRGRGGVRGGVVPFEGARSSSEKGAQRFADRFASRLRERSRRNPALRRLCGMRATEAKNQPRRLGTGCTGLTRADLRLK
jgi:hypothetical protein